MVKKIAVMLDGGHLRVLAIRARKNFVPDYIEKIGHACAIDGEVVHRIMYYDCPPYNGKHELPVSGQVKEFTASDEWLKVLSYKELFSVRLGILKFRGFTLKKNRIPYNAGKPLIDDDFEPKFEQKGVDMRIGIDMANICSNRSVEIIALATNDTDCVPAMKYARRCGLQVALVVVPGYRPTKELLTHSDYHRFIQWPE